MIKEVIVEIDGRELAPDEYKEYICTSKLVDEIVSAVYKRCVGKS